MGKTPGNYAIDLLNSYHDKLKNLNKKIKQASNPVTYNFEKAEIKSLSHGVLYFVDELKKGNHISDYELKQIKEIISKIEKV